MEKIRKRGDLVMYKAKEIFYECLVCGQKGSFLVVDKDERYKSLCLFCQKEQNIDEDEGEESKK